MTKSRTLGGKKPKPKKPAYKVLDPNAGKLSPSALASKVLERERARFRLADDLNHPVDANGETSIPFLPPDITQLSGIELGALQGRFAAFAGYVRRCLAVAEVELLAADEEMKLTAARERLSLHDEGNAKWRDDTAYTEAPSIKARRLQREHKAMVMLLRARLSGLEDAKKTLSREQTRREVELGMHRESDD